MGLDVGPSGGRRYSAIEQDDRTVAILQFFGANGYQVAAGAVLPSGQIDVSVMGQPRPGLALQPALSNGVRVTFTDEEASLNFHTFGGAYIHGSSSQCGTGFLVEEIAIGIEGVTTAAHCTGMDHYHKPNTSPEINYDTYRQDKHLGLDGDVEWHTTDHDVVDDYYADPTAQRDVASVETSAAVNNTYCVYSRMQGTRTCDQVWSPVVAMLTLSSLASNLVGMDDSNTVGGDSGEPWSCSTDAAGTVVGAIGCPSGGTTPSPERGGSTPP
jgi:streptogrisin C